MTTTSIEWTATRHADGTVTPGVSWNPVRGCRRVSAGCQHCYAERMALRFSGPGQPYEGLAHKVGGEARWTGAVRLVPEALEEPLRWRTPRRVFVNSMADLFHEDVTDTFIAEVFSVMAACPQHTFLVLTKRPARMAALLGTVLFPYAVRSRGHLDWPLPNVWLGVSVEDQAAADERVPLLLRTPAAVRWLSCEPLLGPVDLRPEWFGDWTPPGPFSYAGRWGELRLHWVVVGGESGPGARPMHPDWARSLRDQCQAARVPFFFKQWGEWTWEYPQGMSLAHRAMRGLGDGLTVYRVGKHAAGRLLDGREWNEYPEVSRAH